MGGRRAACGGRCVCVSRVWGPCAMLPMHACMRKVQAPEASVRQGAGWRQNAAVAVPACHLCDTCMCSCACMDGTAVLPHRRRLLAFCRGVGQACATAQTTTSLGADRRHRRSAFTHCRGIEARLSLATFAPLAFATSIWISWASTAATTTTVNAKALSSLVDVMMGWNWRSQRRPGWLHRPNHRPGATDG